MNCPICSSSNTNEQELSGSVPIAFKFECSRCGTFIAESSFLTSIHSNRSKLNIGKICGWVFNNPQVILNNTHLDQMIAIEEPSLAEKADLLLLYFAKKYPMPNQELKFQGEGTELSACYASHREEGTYIFSRYLRDYKKYISHPEHGGQPVVISPAGWDRIYELKQVNSKSKKGFCAMWFDSSVSSLWTDGISPAISELGYEPVRIDEHQHNNKIDDEILVMIKKSKFLVADFTGNRGGVYFEAGYGLGLGIPVIWTVKHENLVDVHFDNRQYNFLLWEEGKLDEFKKRLKARIEATVGSLVL